MQTSESNLRHDNSKLRSELSAAKARTYELERELSDVNMQISTSGNAAMASETALRFDNKHLKSQITELQAQLASAEAGLVNETALNFDISNLKRDLAQFKQKASDAESTCHELRAENHKVSMELKGVKAKLMAVDRQLSEAPSRQASASQHSENLLRSENHTLRLELTEANSKVSGLQQEVAVLKQKLRECEASRRNLQDRVSDNAAGHESLLQLKKANTTLETINRDLQQQVWQGDGPPAAGGGVWGNMTLHFSDFSFSSPMLRHV